MGFIGLMVILRGWKRINLYGSIELMKNEQLVLEIYEEQYIKKKLQSEASRLKFYLDKKEIVIDSLYIKKETIFFELLDSDDAFKLKALLSKEFSSLWVNNRKQIYELKLTSLILQKVPILTTSMIRKASVGFTGSDNRPSLNLTFTPLGKEILADYTSTHILKKMAVVIDEKVYVAPRIVEGIFEGKLQVTGDFDAQELHNLSISLNADFLVPMQIVERKSFVEE